MSCSFHVSPGSLISLLLLVLSGCTAVNSEPDTHTSANQNSRVSMVIIHHTTVDYQESLDILTLSSDRPVSAHYLVPEPGDSSYSKNKVQVQQLVPESRRAWHAGRSYWAAKTGLNDQSIGIELVNLSYCHVEEEEVIDSESSNEPAQICFFPDFAENQIALLVDLLRGIVDRHPDIKATNIIGHSDIAPGRKSDPGPRFPWQHLYKQGFGAWYDDNTVVAYWQSFHKSQPPLEIIQQALKAYGYGIEVTGTLDRQTRDVLRAFQLHFVPDRVTGVVDTELSAILFALVDKYYPTELDTLLTQLEPQEQE